MNGRLDRPRGLRRLGAVVVLTLLAVAAPGSVLQVAGAAGIGSAAPKGLGGSKAAITSCDADSVTVTYTTAYSTTVGNYQVTSVLVSGIAAACTGKTLNLTIRNSSLASLYGSSLVVSATSHTFTPATPLAAPAVAGWAVSIVG
jgi:hypothetical protein